MKSLQKSIFTKGFTLIELMVVVGIGILILGWGLPNLLRIFERQGISKAAFDVMEGCNQARAFAILSGRAAEFVLRAEDGQMSIREAKGPRLMNPSQDEFFPESFPETNAESNAETNAESFSKKAFSFDKALEDDVAVELLDVNFIDQMGFPEARVRFYPNGTSDEFTIVLRIEDAWRKISLDPICATAILVDLADLK